MIEVMEKKYLTDKEAASRYGYSVAWFKKTRQDKKGPPFLQLEAHCRVLYPLEETDAWFKKRLEDKE